MSLYKTAFSAGDQHVLTFSHWAHLFFATLSKGHHFFQNSVFCLRSARCLIFSLGALLLSDFQQSARVCAKHVFSPRSARTVIFAQGAPLFNFYSAKCTSLSKEQNSVISPTSARFNIFALCGPLLSDFLQRASVCPKQRFQQEISTFCHFRTGCNTF